LRLNKDLHFSIKCGKLRSHVLKLRTINYSFLHSFKLALKLLPTSPVELPLRILQVL
jgi:hypothetical protein